MLTLAIDSTAATAACALSRDGRLVAMNTVDGRLTHSEILLPMIERMLADSALKIDDVDMFACATGPGSFTGVRIGAATIKGLAFGSGKPCVGVSTLVSLAYNLELGATPEEMAAYDCGMAANDRDIDIARQSCENDIAQMNSDTVKTAQDRDILVVPVMDARRGQVYTALFKSGERRSEDMLIKLEELRERLDGYTCAIYFCGDGYDVAMKFFAGDRRVRMTSPLLIPHNAFSVARAAERVYTASTDKTRFSCERMSPRYLRAPQAERERLERMAATSQ